MLVRVVVDNFMSFNERTELTMVSSSKTTEKPEHETKIEQTSLLKYAAIYGANAAGKSNLIEVFKFVSYCVFKGIPAEATQMFCKINEENIKRPSNFEIDFVINGKFYAYGLSVLLSERKLLSEWMFELFQDGTAKELFTYEYNKKPVININTNTAGHDKARIETYLNDFNERSNMLFLHFMNKNKQYEDSTKLFFFLDAYKWFTNALEIYSPTLTLLRHKYYYDEASLSKINELIKLFDTGITEIYVAKISIEQLKKELPEEIFQDVMENIKDTIEQNENDVKISMRLAGSFYNIESKNNGDLEVTTTKFKHGNSFYDFTFREESDGTRRLFALLDILLTKSETKVFIVDELERSLHPKLTCKLIELFNKIHTDKKMQLIFTTHEATIMDQNMFRRDEIWFVERNKDNISKIYSLDRFKQKHDKILSKSYLEGRYGAIPVFSSFEFLGE